MSRQDLWHRAAGFIQILFSKELRIATDLQSHNFTSIRIYIGDPYNFGKVLST